MGKVKSQRSPVNLLDAYHIETSAEFYFLAICEIFDHGRSVRYGHGSLAASGYSEVEVTISEGSGSWR